jgi:hypothetical protein
VEAGQLLQRALLFGERKTTVISHPLRDVFLPGGGTGGCAGGLGAVGLDDNGGWWILLCTSAGERRHGGTQQNKCRAETEPGWTMRFHIGCGMLNWAAVRNG